MKKSKPSTLSREQIERSVSWTSAMRTLQSALFIAAPARRPQVDAVQRPVAQHLQAVLEEERQRPTAAQRRRQYAAATRWKPFLQMPRRGELPTILRPRATSSFPVAEPLSQGGVS